MKKQQGSKHTPKHGLTSGQVALQRQSLRQLLELTSDNRYHGLLEQFATQRHTNLQHQQPNGSVDMRKKPLSYKQKLLGLAMTTSPSVRVAF